MIYFDTSYIVKCYLNETGSTEVRALAQSAPGLSSCLHGRAEFWTAVKRNVREKLITAAEATATFERFEEDEAAGVWRWFPVEPSLIEMTCRRVGLCPGYSLSTRRRRVAPGLRKRSRIH